MNVVIPMAGRGSRFAKEGYSKPKPFIDVLGKPMIVRVLENLAFEDAHYILVLQRAHLRQELEICEYLKAHFKVEFILLDGLTEGTACSILHARRFINTSTPLLIANADQIIDIPIQSFLHDCINKNFDGSILSFIDKTKNPKWSFVRTQGDLVLEVREKEPISEIATIGIYWFREGRFFVDGAIDMIVANERVKDEFYTSIVYNYLLKEYKIGFYTIDEGQMHGLGTPQDLLAYEDFLRTLG